MKILAIRGSNLASLGRFDISLEDGPLGQVGLFAVTGPTGAGKSTLLDAMCLALFDRMPRLRLPGGAKVGAASQDESQYIRSNDVRSILRRGAASGWAEVDFLGRDGERYTARWSVRRARKQASGKLQPQEISLVKTATEAPISGTKTETLSQIADRLGLSFDQFCRSALLAQGDFTAFLQAKDDERAALLEKMTGTEIYASLSREAFERNKAMTQALDEDRRLLSKLGVMSPVDRAEQERALAVRVEELEAIRAGLERQERAARWYEQLKKLKIKEQEGENLVTAAGAARRDAASREVRLERALRARPLRPRLEAADSAAEKVHGTAARLETLRRALRAATARVEALGEEHAAARQRHREAGETMKEQRPLIEQARALEIRLADAGKRADQARAEGAEAAAAHEAAVSKVSHLDRELAEVIGRREVAAAWIASHEELAPLAEVWERCEVDLRQVAAALEELSRSARQKEQLTAASEEAARAAALRGEQQRAAMATLAAAEEEVIGREGAADEICGEDLRRRRRRQDRRRGLAEAAVRAAASAGKIEEARTRELEVIDTGLVEAERGNLRISEINGALGELGVRIDAGASGLKSAEDAQTLEQRRQELVSDEPCPLCGSTAHPWADGSPLSGLVNDLRQELEVLTRDQTGLQQERASLETRVVGAAQRAREAEERAGELEDDLRKLQADWFAARAADGDPGAGLPARVEDPGAAPAAADLTRQVARQEERLEEQEQELRQREEAARQARKERDEARAHLDDTARIANEARQKERTAVDQARRLESTLAEQQAIKNAALDGLRAPLRLLEGWEDRLGADPGGFCDDLRTRVQELGVRRAEQDEAGRAASDRLPHLEAARATAGEVERRARQAAEKLTREQSALEALEGERAALLGGRGADLVEQELTRAIDDAGRLLSDDTRQLNEAQQALTGAGSEVEASVAALAERRDERAAARATLDSELAEAGLSVDELRELSRADQAWIEQEQQELTLLGENLSRARSTLKERRERRQEHEGDDPPRQGVEDVAALLTARRAEEKRLSGEAQAFRVTLHKDDDLGEQSQTLQRQIEDRQARAVIWSQLNELIGSKDGKKFRRYAQTLTLDSLLVHANDHLSDVARRYRLQRVPGQQLELQVVDHEMGDEVRSVNSLSGGESFLVSLALALGLASLSSSETPVSSLFIDEGFGTLDQETLEIALSALDALQATGRQVGVISHVHDLADHIGAQVKVTKVGAGRSVVKVCGLG